MATLAYTVLRRHAFGNQRRVDLKLTFDTDYPSNGYAITAAQCELGTLDGITFDGPTLAGYPCVYDKAAGKIKIYGAANATEAAAGLNALDGDIVYCTAYGDTVNTG